MITRATSSTSVRLVGAAATVALMGVLVGCAGEEEPAAAASSASSAASPSAEQPSSEHAEAVEWSYAGESGPDRWGEVAPTCAASATAMQSPIDIEPDSLVSGPVRVLEVDYGPTSFELENNGHTIEAVPSDPAAGTVTIDSTVYRFQQLHLHSPSEHLIDGREAPMELHLVNKAEDGSVAVLGVLLDVGEENAVLAELFERIPASVTGEDELVELGSTIDVSALLPQDPSRFEYTGSLTTPPCSEGVVWTVFEQPVEVSQDQLDAFVAVYPDNHRPVQDRNDRPVVEGHDG